MTDDANKIIIAFITNVNKPKVRRFIGSVININKGLIIIFKKPKNKASHKAAQKPAISAPGKIYELINIAAVIISHFNNIFIVDLPGIEPGPRQPTNRRADANALII